MLIIAELAKILQKNTKYGKLHINLQETTSEVSFFTEKND